jgi:hypothetical protein
MHDVNTSYLLFQVDVNSFLIWCGLRGSHFGTASCPGLLSLYQKLVLTFLSLMFVRWLLIMFLPSYISDSASIMQMLGEMDRGESTIAGRLFYRTQTLLLAFMSLASTVFCYRHRNNWRVFAWLKVFELMKSRLNSTDLSLTEYMAEILWERTLTMMNLVKVWMLLYGLSIAGFLFYQNQAQIQAGDVIVIAWCAAHGLWMFIVGVQVVGLIAIWHCVVFYAHTRMKKLIFDMELMNDRDKILPQMVRAEVLYNWLVEFDLMHVELESHTLFWQNFILLYIGLGFFLLMFQLTCFCCFYPYFSNMEWTIVGICGLISFTIWLYSFLKPAVVSECTKELYRAMNRFCLIPTHDFIQVKMDNYVKKFSAVNRQIGFHCYRMFYLSNEFLYHVSSHV